MLSKYIERYRITVRKPFTVEEVRDSLYPDFAAGRVYSIHPKTVL